MSDFKFACPVCGQHITCAIGSSGSQMECPTCYRKLIVPQPPAAGSPNLILTASEVQSRPIPLPRASAPVSAVRSTRKLPVAAIGLGLLVCAAAGGVVVFRDKIFKPAKSNEPAPESVENDAQKTVAAPEPPENDTNWTLNLADAKIPDAAAAGRINGRRFQLQKATIKGGTLDLRQGAKWPPDVGLTVHLFAQQAEELSGKAVTLETNRDSGPKLILRWKDEAGQPVTSDFRQGFAARIEFGAAAGGRLPGKIYLSAPDAAQSYVAGTFDAEIRKPTPPKSKPKK